MAFVACHANVCCLCLRGRLGNPLQASNTAHASTASLLHKNMSFKNWEDWRESFEDFIVDTAWLGILATIVVIGIII